MKNPIRLFATFLILIFLTSITQAQSNRNKLRGDKRPTHISKTKKKRNATVLRSRAEMQRRQARKNALNKKRKTASKHANKRRNTAEFKRRAEMKRRQARKNALNKKKKNCQQAT